MINKFYKNISSGKLVKCIGIHDRKKGDLNPDVLAQMPNDHDSNLNTDIAREIWLINCEKESETHRVITLNSFVVWESEFNKDYKSI